MLVFLALFAKVGAVVATVPHPIIGGALFVAGCKYLMSVQVVWLSVSVCQKWLSICPPVCLCISCTHAFCVVGPDLVCLGVCCVDISVSLFLSRHLYISNVYVTYYHLSYRITSSRSVLLFGNEYYIRSSDCFDSPCSCLGNDTALAFYIYT